jgi:hypothetical protein
LRAKRTNVTGGVPHVRASLVAPPPRPIVRPIGRIPASEAGQGGGTPLTPARHRGCECQTATALQTCVIAPIVCGAGAPSSLHSRPLVRGRAERRVPVAPLGLMRCGLPQLRVHQDFRRRRASARRSACGVFSVACTSAMANGPITKINVPGRRDRVAAKHLAERVSIGRPSHCPGLFPSEGRPSPCQWQCWRRSVLPEDRRSPMNRVTPHLRRPPHPTPRT